MTNAHNTSLLDAARTALVIVDLQNDFISAGGAYDRGGAVPAAARALPGRILPVMVTTLPRDEIASELGDAASSGVYVIAGDDFQQAIGRTLIPPHADQLFAEAEQSLQGIADVQPAQA